MDTRLLRERMGFTKQAVITELINIYPSAESIATDIKVLLEKFDGYYSASDVCYVISGVIDYYMNIAGAKNCEDTKDSRILIYYLNLQQAVLTMNYSKIEMILQNRPQES